MLEVKQLQASIEGQKILQEVSLNINKGEIVALMGPNGSGKSTLANVLMGNPDFAVDNGEIFYKGEKINDLSPDERAKKGIFLSFQYPAEISGVTVSNFLRTAYNNRFEKNISVLDFRKLLKEKMELLKMPSDFADRYLNEGFSGGEKKRAEILQLSILQPELAILDETDSGLDIDALKIVANGVNFLKKENPNMSVLLITHYQRILEYIKPDRVYIMVKGKIVQEGRADLVHKLEKEGYAWLHEDVVMK
ncbi:MAG: Fe-S cluster assembly ATPase SufC [Candidatus Woesearchaeota archaeon]